MMYNRERIGSCLVTARVTISFPSVAEWQRYPAENARHALNSRRWLLLSYSQPWWRGEPLLVLAEDASSAVFLPLRVEQAEEAPGLAVVRFSGHGFFDIMDGWYAEDRPPTADILAAVLDAIGQRLGSYILDLAGLLPGSPLLAALLVLERTRGIRLVHSPCETCLIADTSGGLDAWGRGFRRTLRKRLRQVARLNYRLVLPETPEQRAQSASALLAYHEVRWARENDPTSRAAIVSIVTTALDAPEAQFPTLITPEGHPISVLLVLESADMNAFYMQGFDPAYMHVSPSRCTIALYLRHLAAHGRPGLNFLRGSEEYKLEFCDREHDLIRITASVGDVPDEALGAVHASFI